MSRGPFVRANPGACAECARVSIPWNPAFSDLGSGDYAFLDGYRVVVRQLDPLKLDNPTPNPWRWEIRMMEGGLPQAAVRDNLPTTGRVEGKREAKQAALEAYREIHRASHRGVEANPAFRQDPGRSRYLFHGTTLRAAKRIAQEGLRPATPETKLYQAGHRGRVYTTPSDHDAYLWAIRASEKTTGIPRESPSAGRGPDQPAIVAFDQKAVERDLQPQEDVRWVRGQQRSFGRFVEGAIPPRYVRGHTETQGEFERTHRGTEANPRVPRHVEGCPDCERLRAKMAAARETLSYVMAEAEYRSHRTGVHGRTHLGTEANPTPAFSSIVITVPHGNPWHNDVAAPFVAHELATMLAPVAKIPLYFLANVLDRDGGDMNRPETRSDPWRQSVLQLCRPGVLILDIHSFPPVGGSGRFTGLDACALLSWGRTDPGFAGDYMRDIGADGLKVGVQESKEPNDIVISAVECGATGILVEHNEKHASIPGGKMLATAHMRALKRLGVW